jgi:hypothetical protein
MATILAPLGCPEGAIHHRGVEMRSIVLLRDKGRGAAVDGNGEPGFHLSLGSWARGSFCCFLKLAASTADNAQEVFRNSTVVFPPSTGELESRLLHF